MANSNNEMQNSMIDQDWPENELELVSSCPYCASKERKLAYKDVQDWSFYSAPGKWTYWDCKNCDALYLSPRPIETSMGKAYASYYTHNTSSVSIKRKLKTKFKNEFLSHSFSIDIPPRLNLPKYLNFLLIPFKCYINVPFGLEQLLHLPKGKLLDVGCGSGASLHFAQQLGWNVTGLEIDSAAVKAARKLGLNVIEGDYKQLAQFNDSFDCIICSHVLEHVYYPLELLMLLQKSLRHGGVLLLSLPNSSSHVRKVFGENWRGLEAPRHVSIPALDWLREFMIQKNFFEYQVAHIGDWSTGASKEIMKLRGRDCIKYSKCDKESIALSHSDFIQFVCVKH